jgi:hypothetical protein
MRPSVTRLVVVSCAGLIGLAGSLGASSAAHASETDLGWLRLQPAQGKTDIATEVLTEAPCPKGEAVVVGLTGPGVPTKGDVGYLVGNTALTALQPTTSGQHLIPLSMTFRDWFSDNGVDGKPGATYTVTLVCRDSLSASKTYGSFTGKIKLDAAGGYAAVGEAAKPFNTEYKPTDPLGGTVATTGPTASVKPGSSTAPSSPPTDATAEANQTPEPDGSSDGAAPGSGSTAPAARAAADGGGSGRFLLISLGLLMLAGIAWALVRRRRPEPRSGAHEPRRDSVSAR